LHSHSLGAGKDDGLKYYIAPAVKQNNKDTILLTSL
jgi:hypothetical protein